MLPRIRRLPVIVAASLLLVPLAASAAEHDCGLEPPHLHKGPRVSPRPEERPLREGELPRVARERPTNAPHLAFGVPSARLRAGALSGKTVYVSPGHGFYPGTRWATQRENTNGIVEDLVSTETTSQFLVPLLINAGAHVVSLRESDPNPNLALVDDADPMYSEEGPAELFSDSSVSGYGPPSLPLANGVNPFTLGGNRLMEATVGEEATASAKWVPHVPADGDYNVYVSYTAFSYRVPDAHFAVLHAGGEAHFRVNQRRHGRTWVFLGRFHFKKGQDPARGAVVAFNDASEPGNVSLDAVRLGGGRGLHDTTGIGPSDRPRFEEAARYHAQLLGAPQDVYDNPSYSDRTDDVSARSRFAAWDHEEGEDAVYVAWHTNACGGTSCTARGTDTYVYGENEPDGTYQFSGTEGSDVLATWVHDELVRDIQTGFDATWRNRGIKSAYFGELNPYHNPEMPSLLIEVGFHQTPADADRLKEPLFRYIAARGIAQGIIKYFAEKDGVAPVLPPEPPIEVRAVTRSDGQVEIAWAASPPDGQDLGGDEATSFVVYASADGQAWDDGTEVTSPGLLRMLDPGQLRFFRVTAVNAGGESFPSEVVGVRTPLRGDERRVLIVNGYDRLDQGLAHTEDLSTFELGHPLRVFVDRMNDATYVRRHGLSIASFGAVFDSASNEAVARGAVALSDYDVVDWFVGRGGHTGQLGADERAVIRTYVQLDKPLLLSGSHLVSALAVEDPAFASEVLGVSPAPRKGEGPVNGEGYSFEGLQLVLDDGLAGAYPAGEADALVVDEGSTPFLRWSNGDAAGSFVSSGAVVLAFPFETISSAEHRDALMQRLLSLMGLKGSISPIPQPEEIRLPSAAGTLPAETGCGCTSGSGGATVALLALIAFVQRKRRA